MVNRHTKRVQIAKVMKGHTIDLRLLEEKWLNNLAAFSLHADSVSGEQHLDMQLTLQLHQKVGIANLNMCAHL